MKYPKIHAQVPAGEHFDESAIVNEGGYLTVSHLANIEQSLEKAGTELQTATDLAEMHRLDAEKQKNEKDELQKQLDTANETIASNKTKITDLEAKVVALGKKPSGNGTDLAAAASEESSSTSTKSGLPKMSDPNHPGNILAARYIKKRQPTK